ncbi:MAG: PDZ domain-containing protein [Persicimonas sp.]
MKGYQEIKKLAEAVGGMPVWGCMPGSPAHKAGIQYGDILLRINGEAVSCFEEYVAAKELTNGRLSARVMRGGQTLDVELNMRDPQWNPSYEEVAEQVADEEYLAPLTATDNRGEEHGPN